MSAIEDIYADIDADVSEEEFREAVEQKVEQMGGLADEETAAMLIAHELGEGEVSGIAEIEAGMEEVKFLCKVTNIGELRTFERDDGEGTVLNIDVADETGSVRVALWDEQATAAAEELDPGDVLRVSGRPKEGYSGLEVSADRVEGDDTAEVDVDLDTGGTIESLSLGQSDVTVRGRVLGIEPVRTFDRDDGSEGRVSNIVLGDEAGRIRVTLWDDMTEAVESVEEGDSVEVVDGYTRERDGDLELHLNDRSAVERLEEDVTYVPDTDDIAELELGETADIAGVVRSADPKRTFDRDDGSEGQVRNVRVQDGSGDIRVALWGEKADRDLQPGDEALFTDVEIQEGWQDDLEASAGWRSTVSLLDGNVTEVEPGETDSEPSGGEGTLGAFVDDGPSGDDADITDQREAERETGETDDESSGAREFTGTVVQTGNPVMLDDGSETMTVLTDADLRLGQEVTVRGELRDGRLYAEELF